jgi:hypothetical protein
MGTDSRKEKSEVCLDLDRPSHGRSWASVAGFLIEFAQALHGTEENRERIVAAHVSRLRVSL